jgi:hypothetical protein
MDSLERMPILRDKMQPACCMSVTVAVLGLLCKPKEDAACCCVCIVGVQHVLLACEHCMRLVQVLPCS